MPGEPEQDQVIDEETEGSGAPDGSGRLALRVGQAQELLGAMKSDLQGPAADIGFQDEDGINGQVGAEEGLVAALAAGVADQDDLDRCVAQSRVPERAQGQDLQWRQQVAICCGLGSRAPRRHGQAQPADHLHIAEDNYRGTDPGALTSEETTGED